MTEESFTFDGRAVRIQPGDTIASALWRCGVRTLRTTAWAERRGMHCGIGVCQDCLVSVDGDVNLRACLTAAAPGLVVRGGA